MKSKLDDCQTAVPRPDGDLHWFVGHESLSLLALVDHSAVDGPLKSRSRVGLDGDRSDDGGASDLEAGNELLWHWHWSVIDVELSSGVGEAVLVARVLSAADQALSVIFRLQMIAESRVDGVVSRAGGFTVDDFGRAGAERLVIQEPREVGSGSAICRLALGFDFAASFKLFLVRKLDLRRVRRLGDHWRKI